MNAELNDDVEKQIEALAGELAALTERRDAAVRRVRELMAAEDFKAGVFHAQAIFETQQEKLALETEMELVRRKRNRLLMPQ